MKAKTLLSLAIVVSMLLAAMPLVAVKAQETTLEIVLSPDPGRNYKEMTINTDFTAEVRIYNAPDITQWLIELTWDPTVVALKTGTVADVTEGPFMKKVGTSTVILIQPPELGRLPEITCANMDVTKSGSDVAATIAFRTLSAVGVTSPLHLVRAFLLNGLTLVPCTPVDGMIAIPPPPPTPPTAVFAVPGTILVGETITLNAVDSTDGYDTLPTPGEVCQITEFKWEIDVGNDGTVDETLFGEIQSYMCAGPGPVKITLTVTAPDPTPPSANGYVDHASVSKVVQQLTPILGPKIDVYTERGGQGLGWDPGTHTIFDYSTGWSDAFGPQEEITVYAKVTYNDAPVEFKPVGFDMLNDGGYLIDSRTAYTGANGIAVVTFRIPWQGSGAEGYFGDYSIWGSVTVSEVVRMDICKFRYGYIVSISSVTPTPGTVHKLDNIGTELVLHNISWDSKTVIFTVTLCDECGVPIGLYAAEFTADEDTNTATSCSIGIPTWAFVGTGHVYANLLTARVAAGGVPLCPEVPAIFTIVWP